MKLKRVTKHVSDHNWFAAALELVIVVVGILLAVLITDAYENRSDRQQEAVADDQRSFT